MSSSHLILSNSKRSRLCIGIPAFLQGTRRTIQPNQFQSLYTTGARHTTTGLKLSTRAPTPTVTPPPISSSTPRLFALQLLSSPLAHSRSIATTARTVAGTTPSTATISIPGGAASTMVDIDVETVLKGKYPAKAHAKRVVEYIRTKIPDASGVIFLEGRSYHLLEDSDEPVAFRQRRPFMYLAGVDLADCAFIYDIDTAKSTLFIPPIDPEGVMWTGLPLSAEEALEKYDVDAVLPTTELNPMLAKLGALNPKSTVFAIAERVATSVTFLEFGNKDFAILGEAIDECRVVKDDYEIALIKKANQISGAAHRAALENVRKAKNEYELEGVFVGKCIQQGAKKQAYPSIVASGRAAATLHYVHNDKPLAGKDLLLLDAGAEWSTYASDITRTFPISGRFTEQSRAIYEIVLQMQNECTEMLKEGVFWDDVHLRAHEIAIDGLLSLGILKGNRKEILEARTSAAFLPHGLGHYLGMDTHDTGGHPNYSDPDPLFRYLRVRRKLPAGSVVTVEPGIYFCEFIIRPYLKDPKHSKYIDENVLNNYWDVGGVRIEDNILITKDGYVNLTDAIKDPDEMEKIILGS